MSKLMRPRWVQRVRALVGGYFWLPCPLCGQMFGGHEWTEAVHLNPFQPFSGQGVCPDCAEQARRHNEEFFARSEVRKQMEVHVLPMP